MKNFPKLIGLAGTNGAGKDTVGEILAKKYNYWFFSFTDLLRQECQRRQIPAIRENLRTISAEWRRQSGLATLIDRSIKEFNKLGGQNKYRGAVLSSLRNPFEADQIHNLGGAVVWVDADPKVRYDRIQQNAAARNRTAEDIISYEDFLKHEAAEMQPPKDGDAATLNGGAVKERADILIINNTYNLKNLEEQIAAKLHLA